MEDLKKCTFSPNISTKSSRICKNKSQIKAPRKSYITEKDLSCSHISKELSTPTKR